MSVTLCHDLLLPCSSQNHPETGVISSWYCLLQALEQQGSWFTLTMGPDNSANDGKSDSDHDGGGVLISPAANAAADTQVNHILL
jgi:hypothetical protein